MVYGHPSTTNNVAEYRGLVHVLRQASACGYSLLHVVRNSSLVIPQLRTYLPPRKHHLALLYREARTFADAIGVVSWGHHYRRYNKMEDHVAYIAMITCSSVQMSASSDRKEITKIAVYLENDVNHWLETSIENRPI